MALRLKPPMRHIVGSLQLLSLFSRITHWEERTSHWPRDHQDQRQGVRKEIPMDLWSLRYWKTLAVPLCRPRETGGRPCLDLMQEFHFVEVPTPNLPSRPFKPLSEPHISSSATMVDATTLLALGLGILGWRNPEIRRMITSWLQSPLVDSLRINTAADPPTATAFSTTGGRAHRRDPARQTTRTGWRHKGQARPGQARMTRTGWRRTGSHSNQQSKSKTGAHVTSSFTHNVHQFTPPNHLSRTMTRFQCPNCDRVAWLHHVNNVRTQN